MTTKEKAMTHDETQSRTELDLKASFFVLGHPLWLHASFFITALAVTAASTIIVGILAGLAVAWFISTRWKARHSGQILFQVVGSTQVLLTGDVAKLRSFLESASSNNRRVEIHACHRGKSLQVASAIKAACRSRLIESVVCLDKKPADRLELVLAEPQLRVVVCSRNSAESLSESVSQYLARGWAIDGEVQVSRRWFGSTYAQRLLLPDTGGAHPPVDRPQAISAL
jgi:hypothetical protein